MNTYPKRAMVTLLPEWEPTLSRLKKEMFYNDSQAEMFRYIISRGLTVLEAERTAGEASPVENRTT